MIREITGLVCVNTVNWGFSYGMWNSLETWSNSTEVWYGMGFLVKQNRSCSRTWDIYKYINVNFNSCMFKYCKVAVSGLQNQNLRKIVFHFWLENMYETADCD